MSNLTKSAKYPTKSSRASDKDLNRHKDGEKDVQFTSSKYDKVLEQIIRDYDKKPTFGT